MSEITDKLMSWNKKHGKNIKWTKVGHMLGMDVKALSSYTRGRTVQKKDEMQVEMFLLEYPIQPRFESYTDDEIKHFIKNSFVNVRGLSMGLGMGNKLSQFMCGARDIPVKRRYEVVRELSKWGLR